MQNELIFATKTSEPSSAGNSRVSGLTYACACLLIVALWIATRPYFGVVNDSRFYSLQAVNSLVPTRLSNDLYFRYGSQDNFSIFTLIYKLFVAAFGLGTGNIILTILAELLWVFGLLFFARSLFRDQRLMFLAAAAVIILPGGSFLRYGEQFLTPRLLSEALTFLALGSMLYERPIRALQIFALSVTIHPLMTLPGLAVFFLHQALKRPAWWVIAAVAIAVCLGAAFFQIQPFARILLRFDPAWFAAVKKRNSFCFVSQWDLNYFLPVLNTFALAALGLSLTRRGERQFLITVLLVTLGGLLISLLGGDLLHNVLIIDAQLWRATWLLAVVAHLLAVRMLLSIQSRGKWFFTNARFLFFLALALLALTSFLPAMLLVAPPLAVLAWLVCAWEHHTERPIPTGIQILTFLCVGIILGLMAILIRLTIITSADLSSSCWEIIRNMVIVAAALGCLAALLSNSPRTRNFTNFPIRNLSLSAILVAIAVIGWDQRSPWVKFVDTTESPPASLTRLINRQLPIYWEGDVDVPWFVLRQESYFSCAQGTGILFSRGTAMEYQRRFESFQPLDTLDFKVDSYCAPDKTYTSAVVTRDELAAVCKKEPDLGTLVLISEVADAPRKIWVSPVAFQYSTKFVSNPGVFSTNTFFIYSCADLRS